VSASARPTPPPDAAIRSTLTDVSRDAVAARLQPVLVDLIDLALTAKQLHWNVTGPAFKPVHEHLDELVVSYRDWSDQVAERLAAVGVSPDGRVQRVGGDSPADPAPEGWIVDRDAITVVADRVEAAARAIRERLDGLGDHDAASEDLLVGILEGLEQQLWMLSAQLAR
jgi:starvation-inducible DNA-binding protein